jgi:hypothetical protein
LAAANAVQAAGKRAQAVLRDNICVVTCCGVSSLTYRLNCCPAALLVLLQCMAKDGPV